MSEKVRSPRHDDERPHHSWEAAAEIALRGARDLDSTAAPDDAHDARHPSGPNRMAPVHPEPGAAVKASEAMRNEGPATDAGPSPHDDAGRAAGETSTGAVTAGAGAAGMAGSSGVTRPGDDIGGAGDGRGGGVAPRRRARGSRDPALASRVGPLSAIHGSERPSTAAGERTPATPAAGSMPSSHVRTILHVDIDAFFAAIEQQRDPRLRGRPVIVGAGVIASCSYEARRFGLKAGMRLSEAKRLCPDAVIIDGHAQVYRCFAETIFELCRGVSPSVETFLDEAYCDLTGTERLHGDLVEAVRSLKRGIREATGLGVTCGLGPNRMLAKLVGKTVKPDGLARIVEAEADAFLVDRPIDQLAGVGRAHAKTLRSMNIHTIGDLRALPMDVLEALFGTPGRLLHERCRGRDTAVVSEREIPLSISRETSFHRDTADRVEHEGMMEYLVGRACRAAREMGIRPRTVAVRIRYAGGDGDERARSLKVATHADPVVLELALDLLRRLFTRRAALHAIGVTLSNFVRAEGEQGCLFAEREAGRRAALYQAFDGVREAFGHGVLVSGRALHLKGRLAEDEHGFVLRTPSLTK